ncbi:MAG: hypothetical protein AB8G11_26205 [Saprospiraceae bacterium]
MKNLLLLFLILVSCFDSIAQRTIAFETQYMEDYKGYAALLSVENELIAMVQGKDCDDFFLTTNNGIIERKEEDCKWNYVPYKYQGSKIFFNEIVNGDTIVFHEKKIYIKPLRYVPVLPPYYVPEKYEILQLTKEELIKRTLVMDALNTNYSSSVAISSVEIHITRNNELIYVKAFKNMNRKDHDIYKKQFEHLKKGDIVEFKEIKYRYPSWNKTPFILTTYDVKILIK